jgi:phage-related protein
MAGMIRIAFLADTKDLKSKLAGVDQQIEESGKKTGKWGDRLRSASKFAAVGLAAVGAGALALAKGAAEDAAAATRLATTLKNSTGATKAQVAATESWISAQGKALGISDDELRPAIGDLARATGDLGQAQKLTSLAMDISAGSGKSLKTVTDALVKAQNGSVGGLSRLGVATKDAEGKTKSFQEIQKDLAKQFKGQASAAANTMTGKLQRAQLALSEAGETIGATLLPALTVLATFAAEKLAPAIDKAFGFIAEHKTTFKIVAVAVGTFAVALAAVNAGIAVYTAVTTVVTAVTKAFALAQKALNLAMWANPIGLIVLAVVALVAAVILAYKKCDTFRAIIDGMFKAIVTAVKFVWDKIKPFFTWLGGVFKEVWNGIQAAWPAIQNFFSGLGGKITGGVGNLGSTLLQKGKDVLNGLLKGVKWIWDHSLLGFLVNRRQAIVKAIGNVTSTLLGKGKDVLRGLFTGIKWVWDRTIKPWLRIGSKVVSAVGKVGSTLAGKGRDLFQGLRNGITTKWTSVRSWISGIGGRIKSAVGNLGSKLYSAGKAVLQGLKDGLVDAWNNTVKPYLSWVTDKIPDWKGPLPKDRKLLTKNGQVIMQSLADGFDKGFKTTVKRTLRDITGEINVGATLTATEGAAAAAATYNIYVTAPVGSNPAEIGREITKFIDAYNKAGGRRRS